MDGEIASLDPESQQVLSPLSDTALANLLGMQTGRRHNHVGGLANQKGLDIQHVRDLTQEDILRLETSPPPPTAERNVVVRLRHKHHAIARLIAEGRSNTEVGMLMNTSSATVANLKCDPTFQELVSYYAEQKDAIFADMHQKVADFGIAVIEELHDRLEGDSKQFTNNELKNLAEMALDRATPVDSKLRGLKGGLQVNITFEGPQAGPAGSGQGPIIDVTP